MARRVRFYRVDGSHVLVTPQERDRRRAAQQRTAARYGKVVIYDRTGRPTSIAGADATARQTRSDAAAQGNRRLIRERDAKGRWQPATGYITSIDTADLTGRRAIGRLIARCYDEAKVHIRVAERNQRRGLVEIVMHFSTGVERHIVAATFPPYRVEMGRGRSLRRLIDDDPLDWRPRMQQSLTLAAPGLIEDSTDPQGGPATDRSPDEIEDIDALMPDSVGEDPDDDTLPDILTSVDVVSEYFKAPDAP